MKTVFPTFSQEGLSKLDFYTIMILQGLMANPIELTEKEIPLKHSKYCKVAINMAKTLIEELEKEI